MTHLFLVLCWLSATPLTPNSEIIGHASSPSATIETEGPIEDQPGGAWEWIMKQLLAKKFPSPSSALRQMKRMAKQQLIPLARALLPKRTDLTPELWQMHIGANGHLWANNHDLPKLLNNYGSPLHVVDKNQLLANINAFQPDLPSDTYAPCEVFVSYKTQPVAGVLAVTHQHGMGAECISAYEVWLAQQLGVPPEQIIYNGPVKSVASIEQAIIDNIRVINCNHLEEVAQIASIAARLGRKARIGIRIVPTFGWNGQFGASVKQGDAMAAVLEAIASPHLELVGLHAHHGSAVRQAEQVKTFVSEVLAFNDAVYEQTGQRFAILDLGGSLGTPTVRHLDNMERQLNTSLLADLIPPDPNQTIAITDYVKLVRAIVASHFKQKQQPMPTIVLEPGRALFGNTQTLLTSVVTVKQEQQSASWAILDGGINLAECVRNEYHQLFVANKMKFLPEQYYRIAGPICTPGDVLYGSWQLPSLQPGDVLAIMDAGAYFVPFATSFSYPQPAIVMLDGDHIEILRRAETFQDMATFDTIWQRKLTSRHAAVPATTSAQSLSE